MTLADVLLEILQRLGPEGDTVLAWEQVRRWPKGAIEALQEAGWVAPIAAATMVECSGCEENCFKPVHVLPARNGQPARAYVACDEPPAMGRVKIDLSRLRQWQVTNAQLARWLTGALGLKGKPERDQASGVFTLGNLQGKKRLGAVQFDPAALASLKVSGHSIALSEAVKFEGNHPSIDRAAILGMVDLPPVSEAADRARKRGKKSTETATQQIDAKLGSAAWRKQTAQRAANARHDQPGGSREKQRQMRGIWASGKYSSRDVCAEQECAALGMSFSAARKALINTPKPSRC